MNYPPCLFSRRRFCRTLAAFPLAGLSAGHDSRTSAPLGVSEKVETFAPPVFDQLFPHSNGDNGYEEVMRAGDLVYQSAIIDVPGRTLTQKRAMLALPETQEALSLLHAGLGQKMVQSPTSAAYNTGTSFTYLAPMHALSRLLAVEQYVLLADGKQGAALDSLQTALRLTDMVNALGPYGAMTVVNGQKRATDIFAGHLDQLSARSCERLLTLVRARLAAPNIALAAFEAERGALTHDFVDKLRYGVDAFVASLAASNLNAGAAGGREGETEDGTTDAEGEALMREVARLKGDSDARNAVSDDLKSRINAAMDNAIADLRDPSRTTPFFPIPALRRERLTLSFVWASCLLSGYGKTLRAYQVARTRLQLLGVHAAIRRYRWETGRAPETLQVLGLKNGLDRDPFTRGPLTYTPNADEWDFALSSAGPLPRDRWGNVVPTGKRTPLQIPEAASP